MWPATARMWSGAELGWAARTRLPARRSSDGLPVLARLACLSPLRPWYGLKTVLRSTATTTWAVRRACDLFSDTLLNTTPRQVWCPEKRWLSCRLQDNHEPPAVEDGDRDGEHCRKYYTRLSATVPHPSPNARKHAWKPANRTPGILPRGCVLLGSMLRD